MPNLTPSDIANPKRQSGYNHVVSGSPSAKSAGIPVVRPRWRAVFDTRMGPGDRGPCRRNAIDAAQDYCDYVNSGGAHVPAKAVLKTAGHNGKRQSLPMNDEVQEALGILRDARAARKGKQGYVYLIVEDRPGGGLRYGKVGFSTNPEARVAELQTGNPRPLKLLYKMPGTEADEASLHTKYAQYNCLQEWFWITKELLLEWDASHAVK